METTQVRDSIDQFRRSFTVRGRSANTIRAYTSDLEGFFEWAGDRLKTTTDYDLLACEFLTEFRDEKAPKTTQRRKAALTAYAKVHAIDVPMLVDYTGPTPAPAVAHPLPEGIEGVKRLVAACDTDEERALIGLCGMAGLRISEARTLTVADIDWHRMVLKIRGKGDRGREVPIQKALLVVLAPLVAQRSGDDKTPFVTMPDRTARRCITRMGKRAGLKRAISSHDLRATFGTAAYNKSKDIRAVQELLGHASSRTTEGYTGVSEQTKRDASDLFGEEEDAA